MPRHHPPTRLGRTYLAGSRLGALLLMMLGAWLSSLAPGGWILMVIVIPFAFFSLVLLLHVAFAVTITDRELHVLTICGVRRIPWGRMTAVRVWTEADVPWWVCLCGLPLSTGSWRRGGGANSRWFPFADGVSLRLGSGRVSWQYVAISEPLIEDGRAAAMAVCERLQTPGRRATRLPSSHTWRVTRRCARAWGFVWRRWGLWCSSGAHSPSPSWTTAACCPLSYWSWPG